jgi:drug/metabolite transporter (DMT)-like permease
LLPLGVALNFACFMLVTRQIAKETDPIGLQAVSGVMAVMMIAPAIIMFGGTADSAFSWVSPSLNAWGLLFAIGLLGTLAHLLMTWSLRYAPSATLAPMQYLEIPFATLIGWLIFDDLPNALASVGILITIAAGLYIVVRERNLSRSTPTTPTGPSQMQSAAE